MAIVPVVIGCGIAGTLVVLVPIQLTRCGYGTPPYRPDRLGRISTTARRAEMAERPAEGTD
jgi:hypothetical protein